MNAQRQEIAILKGAIGHARCVLSEPWQSAESRRVAGENLAKYRERLAKLQN